MAIRTEQVSLDIRPCCDARGPVVCGRQGDEGTVLVATVTRDGEPMALDGLTATLKGNVPGYIETVGTVDGSTATFALDSSVFAHRGVHRLYVELSQGADVVASTQSVELRVAPGADASAGDADDFESFVDQMKADYEAGIDQAEAAFDAALDAKQQEAQGLIDELDEALDTLGLPVYRVDGADAVPKKECYFSYEDADMGCDVFGYSDGSEVHQITPAWQTSRGPLVQAHGCAEGVPVAGMRVLGQTRQNLWTNQDTVTRNGVTITNNTDGSIALSGTSTGIVTGGADSYALRPGETYTASVNAASTTSTNASDGSFYVQARAADGSMITGGTHYFGFSTTLSVTFTVPDDAAYYSFGFYCIGSGNTFSGTYRVMLNEGSTAQPWCPPGLTSVSELSIKAGASEGDPDASTAAIDLSGHKLRSLPDGTRDVLTVDGSGAVAVEQAVKCLAIDGTNVKAAYKNNFQFSLNELYKSIPVSDTGVAEIFCDSLPVVSAADIWNGSSIGIGVNSSGTIAFAPPGNLSTIEEANAWLAQHPVTVIYPVATTTTVPLDPITPPTVPAADATLWAASDVPCDLEATTWTASGAEQGRQQAAMVKVAQQVRQQAETVAALTT